MPSFGPVKINQQIEIEIVTDEPHKYRTKVENVTEQFLEILSPMEKGLIISMHNGMSVKVSYFDDLAIYSLYVQVIRQRRGELGTVTLGIPTRFSRIQRRNYVRIDTSIEVEARKKVETFENGETPPESPEEPAADDLIQVIPGTTMDLSGGGIMFRCNAEVQMGELIEITVFLGGEDNVKAAGKVVRFIKMPAHTKYLYAVGIEFTEITEKERDKIIKYIFKKQLELRKKGLL